MSPHTFALLLASFSAIALAGDAPCRLPRPIQVHDLENLSHDDALRLDDKLALYRIVNDSQAEEHEGRILIDCTSPDAVHRTARLLPSVEVRDVMTVRARLHVTRHPPIWGFPKLVEYRLPDAVTVR